MKVNPAVRHDRHHAVAGALPWTAPNWVERRPLAATLAIIVGVFGLVGASAGVLTWLTPGMGETARREIATLVLAAATLVLLSRWSAWRAVGITRLPRPRHLTLMALPVALAAWPLGFGIEGGALALAAALVAELPNSFAEEALMRGVVVRAFAHRKRWLAALVSGIGFGAVHLVVLVWGASLSDVVPLIVVSGLFGIGYACIRMVTHSLWAPIALHMLFNVSQNVGRGLETLGEGPSTLILLVGAVAFPIYGLVLLRRAPRN
ncbi:lysostaphin resistance A-like protein [Sphaerimonospora cavernae]|uniref:Lysostaphin resistance A-like protein n=1 Tax=Sphaerimonospora cavernae TaxID=1740611 RepID=A0ABV6UB05_9ACTN